jgi:uncharacterized membrane protein
MDDVSWFAPVTAMVIGAAMFALPHGSTKRHFFGVTVAPEHWESEAARDALWRYRRTILVATAIALVVWKWVVIAPMLPCVAAVTSYVIERERTRPYAVRATGTLPAPTAGGRDPLPWWSALALPPFVALWTVALYVRSRWSDIPPRFATHWGADGVANGWSTKDFRGVYGGLLFGGGVMVLMCFLALATYYGSRRGPMREGTLKIFIATMYLLGFVFSGVGLLPLMRLSPLVFLAPAPIFIGLIIWMSMKANAEDPGEATPDECWHLGDLYYNPADPALFVQKRMGIGYTFNFANRMSWALLGGFLAGIGGLILLIWK